MRLRTKNPILTARALHPINNDAPSLKMQSSPVNDSNLAIFSPKKTKEIGSQRVGTIPVANRTNGPINIPEFCDWFRIYCYRFS
ncbi:hypothetical protein Hanom_Chr02g00156631 [Helianthus anomalus]